MLTRKEGAAPKATEDGWAVGIAMTDAQTEEEVTIFASSELLDRLGSGGRFAAFLEWRDRIDHVASCKYDLQEFDVAGRVMVTTEDFGDRDWPDDDDPDGSDAGGGGFLFG